MTGTEPAAPAADAETAGRAAQLFLEQERAIFSRTNKVFAWLLLIEWILGIVLTWIVSPRTWIGARDQVHLHLWLSILLGGALSLYPAWLVITDPERTINRF